MTDFKGKMKTKETVLDVQVILLSLLNSPNHFEIKELGRYQTIARINGTNEIRKKAK